MTETTTSVDPSLLFLEEFKKWLIEHLDAEAEASDVYARILDRVVAVEAVLIPVGSRTDLDPAPAVYRLLNYWMEIELLDATYRLRQSEDDEFYDTASAYLSANEKLEVLHASYF